MGDIASNLVGHWELQDNAASTTVVATVGTNGTLTNSGNTSASSVTGPGGSYPLALSLDGTNDFINVTTGNSAAFQNVGAWTIACWLKTSASTGTVVSGSATTAGLFRAGISISTGTFVASSRSTNAGTLYGRATVATYNDGTWHHVAGVVDIANDTIDLYVDGSLIASTTLTNGTIAWTTSATANDASAAVRIGQYNSGSYFNGSLADMRFYQRELVAADISDLYALGSATGNGLVYPQIIGSLIRPTPWSRFLAQTPIAMEAR